MNTNATEPRGAAPVAPSMKQRGALSGILLLVSATVLFAAQDAVTKQLTELVAISQILFVRFLAFALFAAVYAMTRSGIKNAFRSAVPVMQTTRCLMMCSEIALFAYALRFLGIAEIHAIFACFPLLVTALSVPLLGESVGKRRWVAVLCGFVGTLIILRPGSGVFDPHALLALACVVIYSLYNILTRRVSRHDSFDTSLMYFGFVGLAASSVAAIGHWEPVDVRSAWLLLIISVLSVSAHMMLIKALQLTAAVILQPFNYLILVWAILIGYLMFGETLDSAQIMGSLIVVSSGVYIGYREYVLASRAGLSPARKTSGQG